MAITKDQIEQHFKLILSAPTCPFCHQHDFELVLDKNGDVAIFGAIEEKLDATTGEPKKVGLGIHTRSYIAARCKVCNWIGYFDYEEIKAAIEAKAKS